MKRFASGVIRCALAGFIGGWYEALDATRTPTSVHGFSWRLPLARFEIMPSARGPGQVDRRETCRFAGISLWARLGSNQRPLACEEKTARVDRPDLQA
jgi:hypothetical protein